MSAPVTYPLIDKLSTINHQFHGEGGPYYGIELEVNVPWSTSYRLEEIAAGIQRYNHPTQVFHCRKERGIGCGFELVFDPCTLEYLRRSFPWDMLWLLRAEYGVQSGDAGNCGLHVHFDKSRLTRSEHIKFELFFHRQRPFIELFSRREGKTEWQWEPWRSRFELGKTEMHNRCISWRHEDTVEVRTFKGTMFYNVILASVEFVDALIRFVQQHSITLIDRKHESLKAFIKYIDDSDYQHLYGYLTRLRAGFPYKEAA